MCELAGLISPSINTTATTKQRITLNLQIDACCNTCMQRDLGAVGTLSLGRTQRLINSLHVWMTMTGSWRPLRLQCQPQEPR
jgi:hypothetical protein